jgi:hypothetical protein
MMLARLAARGSRKQTGTRPTESKWDTTFTFGNVYTKAPDSAQLGKMVQLADRLHARVQGDDGECYTGDEPLDDY